MKEGEEKKVEEKVENKPEPPRPEPKPEPKAEAKKKLISLQDFNVEKVKSYAEAATSRPNGIECPKCGEELIDLNPLDVFGSNPPTTEVACSRCDYRGRRIA